MKYYIINFVLMQLGWAACVIGGNLWGIPTLLVILLIHFSVVSKNKLPEIKFLIFATIIGSLGDTILMHLGIFSFEHQSIIIPIWLICLWLNFATIINNCLIWVKKKPFVGALLGFLFGPPTYYSGTRFDALKFSHNFWISWISIGIAWAVIMPIFVFLANTLVPIETKKEADKEEEL